MESQARETFIERSTGTSEDLQAGRSKITKKKLTGEKAKKQSRKDENLLRELDNSD